MRFWNGIVMYAPKSPEFYAIPTAGLCIFRLMHMHGDTQAWNLYWLTTPQTDQIPLHREEWHRYYESFSVAQTKAFYEALDTVVYNRLTLATLVSQAPREARRLIARARLDRTRFYALSGGEDWRQIMLGRLFLAERSSEGRAAGALAGEVTVVDFATRSRSLPHHAAPARRPA